MPSEVRTFLEGTLRGVQASGSGQSWATGAAAPAFLLGFVQAGMSVVSGQTVSTQMERGAPHHHKITEKAPITLTVTYRLTGAYPVALTSSGASVPMYHLEHRASAPENGTTGVYSQFYGMALQSRTWTEAADGNTMQETWVGLGCLLATASGYLS